MQAAVVAQLGGDGHPGASEGDRDKEEAEDGPTAALYLVSARAGRRKAAGHGAAATGQAFLQAAGCWRSTGVRRGTGGGAGLKRRLKRRGFMHRLAIMEVSERTCYRPG